MGEINYFSTRGEKIKYTPSQGILKGIADDGGLFVPDKFPKPDKTLEQLKNLKYKDLAYEILKLYLTDFTEYELIECIGKAYDEKFDTDIIAPLKKVENSYFLELFHGKTLAFKDMALSILPYLMKVAAFKNNMDKEIVILTATSGDTGKAALEGFKDIENTKIIVFYPQNGVSHIQKLQMTTQKGKNTYVAAIKGNFDDCQNIVKKIFTDKDISKKLEESGKVFSSANSINIGRLIPQIVYYFYGYFQLVNFDEIKIGDKVNFTVPTGNFGNILAGYYAHQMGLPINKLICASNRNKVLYDFFQTSKYDRNREFILTTSPSMDILVSSNLERLLYHLSEDTGKTKEMMKNLSQKGEFEFKIDSSLFAAQYADEKDSSVAISDLYEKGYIMDTHTAVAFSSYKKYLEKTGDCTPNIVISTASPYKFASDVCLAIDKKIHVDPIKSLESLEKINNCHIPKQLKNIDKEEIIHNNVFNIQGSFQYVMDILGDNLY